MIDLVKDYLKFFLSSFVKQFTKTIIYILIIVIFLFIFSHAASAEEINYEFKLNGWDISSFRQNVPTTSNGSQNYLNIKTTNLVDITSVPQYGYVSLCASGGKISYYDSNQLSNVQVINSNNECYNFNSAIVGHVVYFIFEMPMNSVWNCSATGGNCYINDNSYVVWSEYFGATYSLYGFGFGNTRFEFDNSSASIINKGNEIINEVQAGNQAIIDNQNQNAQQASEERQGIWNTLTSGISNIGNWFNNLGSSITNGLTSLGNFIIDGIKGLLIPTDEQIYEIIEDSQEMSENFGFIGQSMNFFINIFTSFLSMTNGNGCAILPEFTLPFSETNLDIDDVTFWEEQQVCLNSNPILSSNIDTIRTITSIALVCMFLTFAASKFFSILSKNDSGTVATFNPDGSVDVSDYEVVNGFKTVHRKRYK